MIARHPAPAQAAGNRASRPIAAALPFRSATSMTARPRCCGAAAAPSSAAAATAATSPRRRLRPVAASAASAAALLPPQYGLVLASLASTAALLQWLAIRVALARREYDVQYPKMYVDDGTERGRRFDCVQRSHQNTLETAPAQMVLIALLGLAHPVPAAAAQAAWVAARAAYAIGYSTGDPKERLPGVAVSGLVYVGTIAAALYEGARMAFFSSSG